MDQENSFVEEINESDLKDEWLKKVLVVLMAVAMLGGTYYFTSVSKNNKSSAGKTEQIAAIQSDLHIVKKPVNKDLKEITGNKAVSHNLANAAFVKKGTSLNVNQPQTEPAGIRPSDKASIAKLALLAAGKADPFSGDAAIKSPSERLRNFLPKYLGQNHIPNPPNLPNISSLPNLNIPNFANNKTPLMTPQNSLEVKGFIGNKVIINVNGISEALKVNESFQGIKVIKVDPTAMTAKFLQDKKVVTKNIQNLN